MEYYYLISELDTSQCLVQYGTLGYSYDTLNGGYAVVDQDVVDTLMSELSSQQAAVEHFSSKYFGAMTRYGIRPKV